MKLAGYLIAELETYLKGSKKVMQKYWNVNILKKVSHPIQLFLFWEVLKPSTPKKLETVSYLPFEQSQQGQMGWIYDLQQTIVA